MTLSSLVRSTLATAIMLPAGCGLPDVAAREDPPTALPRSLVEGPPVDFSQSPCLARPPEEILVIPPGRYDERLRLGELENRTVDMRGTLFYGNPPKRPISFQPTGETCIVGPSIQGQQPRDWTWQQMKSSEDHAYDGDAIGWGGEDMRGPLTIEGAWIDNFEDGLGPPKGPGSTAGRRWRVRHVYARHIRDDFIENDGCIDLEVHDTLVDGTFAFISARPGRGRSTDEADRPAHTVIRDTLVHMQCMPGEFGPGNCGPGLDMGQIFKWSDCGGSVDVKDTIIYVDPSDTRRLTFPEGTYENVIIVWPAEEGATFPARDGLPEGIELSSDVSLWESARNTWLRRHGCDQDGNDCSYLQPSP